MDSVGSVPFLLLDTEYVRLFAGFGLVPVVVRSLLFLSGKYAVVKYSNKEEDRKEKKTKKWTPSCPVFRGDPRRNRDFLDRGRRERGLAGRLFGWHTTWI